MTDTVTKLPDSLANSHIPFFKVSCGCVGFFAGITHQTCESDPGEPMWFVIKACDGDGTEDTLLHNGVCHFDPDKTYTPFLQSEVADLIQYFNRILRDGYKWQDFCWRVDDTRKTIESYPACLHESQTA